ncbi:ATPase AAA [Pontibacillus halophilus JSM 076056 = DSM 19796]|uniref:ATPase AAA n=1 Tax=Pontibacillus halophilus JSM 076056 = DSM 19796 TaxID=1385510 RepID=A0A0A5GI89_9BACI|nr:sigma-54-dependent Fis family transcriptional regulator [Pontibacillus halophilus]KGX90928.1 ATPase AAA [Pontibacillus halophilus JSM 076056 = DSM 19796]
MKRVLVVGAGKGGTALIHLLSETEMMNIVAVVDKKKHAPGIQLANQLSIPVGHDWEEWLNDEIDIVIEATGEEEVFQQLLLSRSRRTVVIPGAVAYITAQLLEEKEMLVDELQEQTTIRENILNAIHDGMVVINEQHVITFMNEAAERIVGQSREDAIEQHVHTVIPTSRLPHVMRTQREEVNQQLDLENNKTVITTRIPLIDGEGKVVGAFAVFKDITDVVTLAEELTDLKEVKTMLEAIIQSSDEAISVVDENGIGLMVNPAYTKITGLQRKEIIGRPATTDISEGESMHMQVLKTRRPVRNVRMKVGPAKKDVIVNVAPIIVDGILKGSVGVLHDVTEIENLTSELKRARQIIRNLEAKYTFDDIVGQSNEMILALEQARVGAKTPASVLLRGESGTGKEIFAHAIHNESDRKHNKFLRVNCASLGDEELERELFGYEEDAFPFAKRGGKRGLFEEANNGSIFLDEIGELSQSMQVKLLRVLQEHELYRVGGAKPVPIDVRVIASTHINMEKAIMNGAFREDFYYRLNRLPIYLPPLRERKDDFRVLIRNILLKLNQDYGRNVLHVSKEALNYLKGYDWPGNVRELENVIGRAMMIMEMNSEVIELEHIPELWLHPKVTKTSAIHENPDAWNGKTLQESLDQHERRILIEAFRNNGFNKTKTAKSLGISIRNLYYKLDKYEIDKDNMQDFSN